MFTSFSKKSQLLKGITGFILVSFVFGSIPIKSYAGYSSADKLRPNAAAKVEDQKSTGEVEVSQEVKKISFVNRASDCRSKVYTEIKGRPGDNNYRRGCFWSIGWQSGGDISF
jgi:hypothetical protein